MRKLISVLRGSKLLKQMRTIYLFKVVNGSGYSMRYRVVFGETVFCYRWRILAEIQYLFLTHLETQGASGGRFG